MVIINFLSKVFIKTRIWQVLLSIIIFFAIIASCSTSLPSTIVTSSSTSSVSDSSTQTINKKLIAVELEKSPSRLSFTPNESISALGGSLRLYYDDYSSRLVSTTDQMIDESKLNTSSVGVSTITLKYAESDNQYSVSYQVQILPYLVPLNGISLDIKDLVVYQGQSFKINLSVSPLNAYYNRVVWNSTNPLVASIDQTGLVTTVNPGKTIISVDVDGKYAAFTTLEVIAEAIEVTTPVESNSLPSVQSFVDLGYIPITSLADLNQIRLESAGPTTFGVGTPYEVVFNFVGNDSSDVSNALNKDYILVNHVDLISVSNWTPIGDDSDRFKGIFEGNNKQIQNLTINSPTGSFLGLFGGIGENAEINNLIITVKSISGLNNIGALAGIVSPTVTVSNVDVLLATSLPSNTIAINGSGNIGGLVGNHAINSSGLGSTPFVFTLGEDGNYHYSNELGRILPHTLSSDDFAVIDQKLLTQQADGRYYLSITQEYNEISYADEVNLHIIEHPENHEVVLSSRREDEDSLSTLIKLIPNQYQPIIKAIDSKGVDVTSTLRARDELWTPYESFENGYYEFFELSLGNFVDADHVQLVYSSVRDYTKDFENMFVLQVLTNDGNWVDASVYDNNLRNSNVRRPISYPRLTLLDLTKTYNLIGRPTDFKIKFGFNRVSYDYFAVSTSPVSTDFTMIKYSPEAVSLNYRGFSNYHENLAYKVFDYHDVSNSSHGFYQNQSGYFTKYGDVTPLLSAKDNQFAIIRYGDELKFSFKAPFKNTNNVRSYVLGGSIWFKHVTRPQGKTVEPIPYQGMSVYPHTQNSVIDQEYIKQWNTRYYPPLIGQTNTITESTTNVIVQGIENVGGLIGYNNGTVSFSATLGNVIGVPTADNNIVANESIGGLIGKHVGDFNISNVSTGGTVTAASHRRVGGLIGYTEYGNISNAQVNSLGINGGDEVGGLIGKTFKSTINNASVNSNYIIGVYFDIGGLVGYADNFNSSSVISNSTIYIASLATISSSNSNAGNVGGFVGKGIYGTYNNNQVLLTGIISGNTQIGGFFGYVESATINNANITASVGNQVTSIINDINYSNGYYIGGFAGFSRNNIVNNFTVTNTLNIKGINYIGGFAGDAQSTTLTSTTLNTINVNIIGVDYVGGLFGALYNTNQMNISNYIVNGEIIGVEYLGGLFGSLTVGASLDIIDNTANVNINNVLGSTDNNFIGGLAGRIDLISNSILTLLIENSSSNGNVIGDYAIGSFIGYFDNSASFSENRTYTKSNSSSGNGTVNGSPASESNQVGVLPIV
jgi:hypothetical protein